AEQWHRRPHHSPTHLHVDPAGGKKLLEILSRRLQHLGDALGRWPAFTPVLADALRTVESRGIQSGNTRQSGRAEAMPLGNGINCIPDGAVRQHGSVPAKEKCLVEETSPKNLPNTVTNVKPPAVLV